MSANKYKKHVIVYAEDEATKQLAEAFTNHQDIDLRRVSLQKCRGWKDAVDRATQDGQLDKGERRAVVLIDLDKAATRVADIRKAIPPALQDRIFIVGWTGKIEQMHGQDASVGGSECQRLLKCVLPLITDTNR